MHAGVLLTLHDIEEQHARKVQSSN